MASTVISASMAALMAFTVFVAVASFVALVAVAAVLSAVMGAGYIRIPAQFLRKEILGRLVRIPGYAAIEADTGIF